MSRVLGKTPFEMFWGIQPNLQHMRPFGSPAVVQIKSGNRNKLHGKGVECKLVGYSSNHKGYRLWCEGKVIIGRTVKFLCEDSNTDNKLVDLVVDDVCQDSASVEVKIDNNRQCPDRAIQTKSGTDDQDERHSPVKEDSEDMAEPVEAVEAELSAPVFKVGQNVSINVPDNFEEASSGPWSKFW